MGGLGVSNWPAKNSKDDSPIYTYIGIYNSKEVRI